MKTTKDKNYGKLLKIIRNRQMVEMHSLIKHYVNRKTQLAMKKFEQLPNDNINMFDSVEKLNKLKQRPHLLVKLEKANS